MTEPTSYRALGGHDVTIPPRQPLPEFEIDLSGLEDEIRKTLPNVKRCRFLQLKETAKSLRKNVKNPSPGQRSRSAEEKQAIVSQLSIVEGAIGDAESRFTKEADAIVQSLVDCFESPELIQSFQLKMSKFQGFGYLAYANSRGKIVDEETPWLKPLMAKLSPAHLTALVRSFREPSLLGLNRDMKLFHEDALMTYLESDIGDVRHLEHDIGSQEAQPATHSIFKDALVRNDQDFSRIWLIYDRAQLDMRDFPNLIRDYLGLDIEPSQVTAIASYFAKVGYLVSDMLQAEQTSYRGYLLERFVNFPKDSLLTKAPNAAFWPYIAENFAVLDRVLFDELKPGTSIPKAPYGALQAIALLPAVPERYRDVIEHLAEFGKKWEKALATKLVNL